MLWFFFFFWVWVALLFLEKESRQAACDLILWSDTSTKAPMPHFRLWTPVYHPYYWVKCLRSRVLKNGAKILHYYSSSFSRSYLPFSVCSFYWVAFAWKNFVHLLFPWVLVSPNAHFYLSCPPQFHAFLYLQMPIFTCHALLNFMQILSSLL